MDAMQSRFWALAQKGAGCWEWRGQIGTGGYGKFRKEVASRVAFELVNGPIPKGQIVCHHCDNPPCVRPDHLFLGTNKDNADDRTRKQRIVGVRARDVREMLDAATDGVGKRTLGIVYGIAAEDVGAVLDGRLSDLYRGRKVTISEHDSTRFHNSNSGANQVAIVTSGVSPQTHATLCDEEKNRAERLSHPTSAQETPDEALRCVCDGTGIPIHVLTGTERRQRVCKARNLAIVRLRRLGLSLEEIGSLVKRDHSTVLYSLRKFGFDKE